MLDMEFMNCSNVFFEAEMNLTWLLSIDQTW